MPHKFFTAGSSYHGVKVDHLVGRIAGSDPVKKRKNGKCTNRRAKRKK
jgi:hypothetical protein